MDIYLIEHTELGYDYYMAHVIVAYNYTEVKILAKNICGDEEEAVWDKAQITNVGKYTGNQVEPFILLSDFRAG